MSRSQWPDPAYKNAGHKSGVEIWRVEKLKIVLQPKSKHGTFYSGDSYIVLHTRKLDRGFEWNIHFWLGKDTTQDEAGVAAYKSVELDDFLGGSPVQYREVQNHESREFLRLFPDGVKYLEGGVATGFKHVERGKFGKKMFQVKGKRNIRIIQVELSYKSLNSGDVFILDDGLSIYCWNGSESSKKERIKATEVARRIRDEERGGKSQILIVDEGKDARTEAEFFKSLGSRGTIKTAKEGGDDETFEGKRFESIFLFKVSDENDQLTVDEVQYDILKRELLDSNDCFILDTGPTGVYVWVGKKCTKNEKKHALSTAMEFVQAKEYPKWTQVTRLMEGAETPIFKQFFSTWNSEVEVGKITVNSKTTKIKKHLNVSELHRRASEAKKTLPDDGNGSLQIWRVEKSSQTEWDPQRYGIFFEGDCYLVLYTYDDINNNSKYIAYYWQGSKSTDEIRTASASFAKQIDDNLDGKAMLVRVIQGKEPEHFLLIFKGRMILLKNESIQRSRSKEGNVLSDPTNYTGGKRFFHIRGTTLYNMKAMQVDVNAANLNSNDAFLLQTARVNYLWEGKNASEEEKDFAEEVSDRIAPHGDLVIIQEGFEMDEFWNLLGGKTEYSFEERISDVPLALPPRLFQCSNASGSFEVMEILDFDQEDLCEDDVMILDAYNQIFVWIGRWANEAEKKESFRTAVDYIGSDKTGRTLHNTDILEIKQFFEPLNFTAYFLEWDTGKWENGKAYEDVKEEMEKENVKAMRAQEDQMKYKQTYSYSELRRKTKMQGIDICNREKYLADDDFKRVFGMNRVQFYEKPLWKQVSMKKEMGLF